MLYGLRAGTGSDRVPTGEPANATPHITPLQCEPSRWINPVLAAYQHEPIRAKPIRSEPSVCYPCALCAVTVCRGSDTVLTQF